MKTHHSRNVRILIEYSIENNFLIMLTAVHDITLLNDRRRIYYPIQSSAIRHSGELPVDNIGQKFMLDYTIRIEINRFNVNRPPPK